MEAAAMTAGPVRNRTAMANVATLFPHAMILGCSAINNPGHERVDSVSSGAGQGRGCGHECGGEGLIAEQCGVGLREDRSTRGVGTHQG